MKDKEMSRCLICKEYDIYANIPGHVHRCPPLWYCVYQSHFDGDWPTMADYDEADVVYATDAEKAAIKYAEYIQSRGSWYPHDMDVWVMDVRCKEIKKYTVFQESVPSYWVEGSPETRQVKSEDDSTL